MKTRAALLLLLFATGMAQAEWKRVGAAVDRAVYINPSSIRKTADGYKAWFLEDYLKRQYSGSGALLSSKALFEYDCDGEQSRLLSTADYSEPMGAGEPVGTDLGSGRWHPVVPDSIGEAKMKAVCPKPSRQGAQR